MKRFLMWLGGLFTAIGRFARRHKALSALCLVLVLGGGAALTIFTGCWRPVQATGAAMPEVTMLETMDLELTVTATGSLQSASTKQVSSSLSYDITELFVQVGDTVQAGDTLCQLDTSEIEENISDAKKQISEAVASDALQLEQAQRKLQTATDNRSYNYSKNDVAVQAALAELNTANATLTDANTKLAAAQVEQDRLAALQASYTGWMADPADPSAQNPYQAEYDAALAAGATEAAASALQAAQQAQSQAAAAVATAQSSYNKAVETRDSSYRSDTQSVESAQDSVDTQKQKDSAESLKKELKSYEENLEDCTITAPIAGTVTAMTAEVGESAGGSGAASTAGSTGSSGGSTSAGSSLFTIEDLNTLEIPASIPEYDALTLETGMSVHITSDAVEDKTWTGQVASISPTASDSSGNFTATVKVTSAPEGLTSGMSAKLEIVTESQTGVYAVPFDAVVTNSAGESVVYAIEGRGGEEEANSETKPKSAGSGEEGQNGPVRTEIAVETGLETDYYVEISGDGLREGLMILNDPNGNNVVAASTSGEAKQQEGPTGLGGLGGGQGGEMGGAPPAGGGGGSPPAGGPTG